MPWEFLHGCFLVTFCRPKDAVTLIRALKNPQTLALVVIGEVILAPIGIFLNVAASNLGAISIVSTVTASRPFFCISLRQYLKCCAIPVTKRVHWYTNACYQDGFYSFDNERNSSFVVWIIKKNPYPLDKAIATSSPWSRHTAVTCF